MTILLPLILLVFSAGGIWFTRKRPIRTQWGVSAFLALIIWIVCLMLRIGPDLQFELSVWQPREIFSSPLRLSLDTISWPIMYAVATVLLAMIFTSASRESVAGTGARVFWFLYTASAVMAILADNLLTVIISWTLFDFLSAIFLIGFLSNTQEIRQVLTRLTIDISGVLFILAGSAVGIAAGTGTSLSDPIETPLGVFLLALGGFVRLGLLPLHFNLPSLLAVRRGLGTLLRLYPPALVLTFIARLFRAGIPEQTLPWFLIAGMSGALVGGLRWLLETEAVRGRPYLILGVSGVGVLAAASAPQAYMGIVAASVVLLLAGAVLSLTVIHTPSHRILGLGAALVLLGIPWFPSSSLTNIAGLNALSIWPGLLWAVTIVLGLSMATLGSMHLYFAEEVPWKTGESLVRLSYGLGLSLPVLTSIGIGFQLRPRIETSTWIVFAIQLTIVVAGFLVLRRLPEGIVGRFRLNLSRLDPNNLYRRAGEVIRIMLEAVQAVAALIEGEAAILWIYAITTFLILASR